nr:hypothetical protein [Rhodoferax sp.]
MARWIVREAMEALRLTHRPTFWANYLQPALKAGLVEMTQPESPKNPTQKYRAANPENRNGQDKRNSSTQQTFIWTAL